MTAQRIIRSSFAVAVSSSYRTSLPFSFTGIGRSVRVVIFCFAFSMLYGCVVNMHYNVLAWSLLMQTESVAHIVALLSIRDVLMFL